MHLELPATEIDYPRLVWRRRISKTTSTGQKLVFRYLPVLSARVHMTRLNPEIRIYQQLTWIKLEASMAREDLYVVQSIGR